MRESSLWAKIKRNVPEVHWQRIESGTTARGIPDVNGCYAGREAWLELKMLAGEWRPEQRVWALKRVRAGGRMYLVVQATNELWVIEIWPQHCLIKGLTQIRVLRQYAEVLKYPVDWARFREIIFNG